jgi:Mg2+ and Co2+ transporter CorA
LLVDPPFKLPEGGSQCLPPEYRSFIRQHESPNANPVQNLPESNREAIVQFLEKRLNENTKLLAEARNDSFLILGDVYRLVASCWMVVNEYINRELATIEDILEKEDPEFHDLKVYLKDLYIHRRRCARYDELIGKAKQQCTNHGQQAWPKLCSSSLVVEHAQDLENDFGYLQARTQGTISRIEKNMSLLTSLVAIGEGEQGLDENHDIARLSFVATILLPFTTVGTIMGMQGSHAPGSSGFWVFWVVAVLLTLGVLGLFSVYDFAYPLFRRLVGKLFIFVGSVFRRWGHKKLGRTNE